MEYLVMFRKKYARGGLHALGVEIAPNVAMAAQSLELVSVREYNGPLLHGTANDVQGNHYVFWVVDRVKGVPASQFPVGDYYYVERSGGLSRLVLAFSLTSAVQKCALKSPVTAKWVGWRYWEGTDGLNNEYRIRWVAKLLDIRALNFEVQRILNPCG